MLKYFVYTVLSASLISIFYTLGNFIYMLNYFSYKQSRQDQHIFFADELKQFNGVEKKELYLALLGNVFDVTKGVKHYGRGQTYNIFIGRDASKNFIDGKFSIEDLSDDVLSLDKNDLLSLDHWLKFYKREYTKVGILIGRHYDETGKLTTYGKTVRTLIKKAQKSQGAEEAQKRIFPPCNIEFDAVKGSRVWCTKKSGGIERDWIGVPRRFYEAGSHTYRCACIHKENENLATIQEYEDCKSDSPSCYVKIQ